MSYFNADQEADMRARANAVKEREQARQEHLRDHVAGAECADCQWCQRLKERRA